MIFFSSGLIKILVVVRCKDLGLHVIITKQYVNFFLWWSICFRLGVSSLKRGWRTVNPVSSKIILITVLRRCFFRGSFMLFLSCVLCFRARLFIDALWSSLIFFFVTYPKLQFSRRTLQLIICIYSRRNDQVHFNNRAQYMYHPSIAQYKSSYSAYL